jgi:hypothetical protein
MISGREARVATFRLRQALTDSDRDTLLRHGYYQCSLRCQQTSGPPGEGSFETYCPDTVLAGQRSASMCVRFTNNRVGR